MNFLDLCNGAGGFHLAAEEAGVEFERVYYSDINEYANKIYQARFPAGKPLGDVRTIRGADLPEGKWIVTAGFPCQPFSVAGSGKGKDDDRYLWHEILRIAVELRPDFFIFENVAGIESVAFAESETFVARRQYQISDNYEDYEEIYEKVAELQLAECCRDLKNAGAAFQVFDIPALGVNAWHRRRRIWIVGSFADTELPELAHGTETDGRRQKRLERRHELRGDIGSNSEPQTARNYSDTDDQRCFGRSECCEDGKREIYQGCGNDSAFGEPAIRDSRIAGNNSDNHNTRQFQPERTKRNVRRRIGNRNQIGSTDTQDAQPETVEESEKSQNRRIVGRSSRTSSNDQSLGQEESCFCESCRIRQANRFNAYSQWQRHWVEVAAELCRSDDGLRNELDVARLRHDIAELYPNASEQDIEKAIDKLESNYRRQRIEMMGNSIVPQIPVEFFRIIKRIFYEQNRII